MMTNCIDMTVSSIVPLNKKKAVFTRNCVLNIVSDTPVIYSDNLMEYILQFREKVLTPKEVELIKVRLVSYNNPSYEARQRHIRRAKYVKKNDWW